MRAALGSNMGGLGVWASKLVGADLLDGSFVDIHYNY